MQDDQHISAVLDASPLIIAAKLQEINALYQTYGLLGIPSTVYRETVKVGKQRGKDDALVIDAAIQQNLAQVFRLTKNQSRFAQRLQETGSLGAGESEALAYARDTGTLLIIDERKGRAVARSHSISYTVLQVFPLEGYVRGRLSYENCIDLLDRIAIAMNTDLAILNGLKIAVEAIYNERGGKNG